MSHRLFVPGRIEVLGKHTDYAGGRSLLAAVDRGFTATATAAADDTIRVTDTARDETVVLPVGRGQPPGESGPGAHWRVYPRAVVRRVARDFPGTLSGCRIELRSDLPPAAGLSSSSALITAVFLALDAVCRISGTERYQAAIPDREALAGYLGAVERGSPFPGLAGAGEGVGTRGGSEDHVAMLCAEPDRLVRYAFEPVRREGAVAIPDGWVFAVAGSGVAAPKTGAAQARYNRLSDQAARAAEVWREATGGEHRHLGAILAEPNGLGRLRDVLWRSAGRHERDALRRRVRHFAAESEEIVPAAADALAGGDIEAFGRLVDRSQSLVEELLGNQVPETVHLARSARRLGAAAASAFGAGFGGSVWALVRGADADELRAAWQADYRAAFPDRTDATSFITPAAAPVRTL